MFPFIWSFVSNSFASRLFLQPLRPVHRHIIHPAAKWSGASPNVTQVYGINSANSGAPTMNPGSAPSTSRDAKTSSSAAKPAIAAQVPEQASTSGLRQPQPGSSSFTLSQPKLNTNSQQQDGTSAHSKVELQAVSPIRTPSTSTNAKASDITSRAPQRLLLQPQPSTSGLMQPQAGSSSLLVMRPQRSTSTITMHFSETASSASTKTQVKASTSTQTKDNPQASTSSAHPQSHSHAQMQPQPGTSTQFQSGGAANMRPHLIQLKEVKLIVLPQQPSIQASALITQPQLRPQDPLQPGSLHRMQGNLIQIEPQPLAQAPAQGLIQAPQAAQVTPVIPPAVLIAAAPERLGPPEAGHRIILGSQAPGEAVPNLQPQADASNVVPPARSLNIRVPNMNSNPPAPPAPAASLRHNRGEDRFFLAPAPNPERVNPAPGLVAVPPAPEDIPRIEDARPGPSAPRERPELQPHVRTLITGVVSITKTGARKLVKIIKRCNRFVTITFTSSVPTLFFFSTCISSTLCVSSTVGSFPRCPRSLCSRTDPKE